MEYLAVRWTHEFPDEPVELLSELSEGRWEVRKVERYADGRVRFASRQEATGSTMLSEVPLPPDDEISADPQFEIRQISAAEFQAWWDRATHRGT